jgi:hypothetical protein
MNKVRLILEITVLTGAAICASPKKQPDPSVSSVYPMAVQRGSTVDVVVRGSNLPDAQRAASRGQ